MPVPNDDTWLPIANSALTIVGTRLLSAPSDASKECVLVKQNWDNCRKSTLRDGLWKFAKETAQLTKDATYQAKFGFTTRFPLPDNFVRMVDFNNLKGNADDSGVPFRIMSGFIYTNMSYANLIYICDVNTVSLFDPLFSDALAAALYLKLCKSLTGSDPDPKVYKDALQRARFVDSTEDPSTQFDIDVWLQSRFGGPTMYRDPQFAAQSTPTFNP